MRTIEPKPRVAVARCPDYETDNLSRGIRSCLDLLGGMKSLLRSSRKVFVKVNLLSPLASVERAIFTHPAFVQEVLRLLKDYDLDITVGDDLFSGQGDIFLPSGYREVCTDLGIHLVNLKETGFVEVPVRGKVLNKFYIARPVLDADVIINLPKLKTHSFTLYTGAVKNMFGVIPHGQRVDCHRRFVRNDVFSEMLVDLLSCVRPCLTIMDAVIGHEGEGPSAGSPKNIGLVLASSDAVALDAAATRIVGYEPLRIYTTYYAHERGLGVGDIDLIEIAGDKLEDVKVKGFKHSAFAVSLFRRKLPSFLYAYIQGQLGLIPEVVSSRCTACSECVNICPVRAISVLQEAAWIDEKQCIHCLCCHEICRFRALRLKQFPLGKLLRTGSSIYGRAASAVRKIL